MAAKKREPYICLLNMRFRVDADASGQKPWVVLSEEEKELRDQRRLRLAVQSKFLCLIEPKRAANE